MKKYVFLFLLLFCFFIEKVNADKIDMRVGFLSNKYYNFTKDGVNYCKPFSYAYGVNEEVLYRIEIEKNISQIIYHLYDFSVLNYSYELRRDLELISYYGYQYLGHQSIEYYMAAQELVWNKLETDMYWTTRCDEKALRIDMDSYKNEIIYLINQHLVKPNLYDFTTKVGSSKRIIDTNHVLNNYDVIYNGENNVRIENDELVVDSYKLGNDSVKLKRKSNDIGETIVYKANNSQTFIGTGNIEEENDILINFNVSGGSISIQRIDSQTLTNVPTGESTLEGALYTVYDINENIIGSYKTNSNGFLLIDNLPLGEFIIKEEYPSGGYLHDDNEYHVTLSFGDVDKVINQIVNVKGTKLEIFLTDENSKPIPNIVFEIYNNNNLIESITTNNDGYISIYLPFGTYTIKQYNSKEGYKKVSDFELVVFEDNITTYRLYNEKGYIEEVEIIENNEVEEEINKELEDNETEVDEEINEELEDNNIIQIEPIIVGNNNEIQEENVVEEIIIIENNETKEISRLPLLSKYNYNYHIGYSLILLSIVLRILFGKHV